MKSLWITATALCLALGGGAVAQTTAEQLAAGQAGTDVAAPYSLDTTLAEIDGVALTLGDLIAIRRELPDQYQALPDEVLFNALREQLIDQIVLAQAALAAGLDKRPAVALRIANQDRAILAEAYLHIEITARVTQVAIEALYKERYADAPPQQEIKAAHILVDSEEKAAELKTELDAGADFAELASEHGTDGTASRGGDLGWFVHSDMVPEFAVAAFAMEPGTVGGPVKTAFGWHLIKVEAKRDRAAPALDDVRGELVGELMQQAQAAVLAEARGRATVVMPEQPPPAAAIRADGLLDTAE